MNKPIEVVVIVEGKTEELFIKRQLSEYLANRDIYMTPIQISKPGQKGGDVKFSRALRDISLHMKQRSDTYISLFIDYYGVKDWPGLARALQENIPIKIARIINEATKQKVDDKLIAYQSDIRFIPYIAIHEFESLLFSDPIKLAQELKVNHIMISSMLHQFGGDPEKINTSIETAPSKRLQTLYPRYKKTVTGLEIAHQIGIDIMRSKCKVFDCWLKQLEDLVKMRNKI